MPAFLSLTTAARQLEGCGVNNVWAEVGGRLCVTFGEKFLILVFMFIYDVVKILWMFYGISAH